MIYEMKYNGNKDTAFVLGVELEFLVKNICKSKNQDFDFINPVPLSEMKKQVRRYNQSKYIANGISQVNKSRYNIWSNVDD